MGCTLDILVPRLTCNRYHHTCIPVVLSDWVLVQVIGNVKVVNLETVIANEIVLNVNATVTVSEVKETENESDTTSMVVDHPFLDVDLLRKERWAET